MKGNRLLAVGMVGMLLAAAACSPTADASPAREASIEVTADQFADTNQVVREVELPEGGILKVSLGSNPSTGFSWPELAPIEAETVLRQTGGGGFAEANGEKLVGAPGVQEWTFEALKKGTTTMHMDYSRPWEGGEKGVWTFDLTVTVK